MGACPKVKNPRTAKTAVVCLGLFLLLGAPAPLLPAPDSPDPSRPGSGAALRWGRPSPTAELNTGVYASQGNSAWAIRFPAGAGTGRSLLDFQDLNGVTPYVGLTLQTSNARIGLRSQYGSGNLSGGRGRDADYLSGGLDFDSRMAVSGDLHYWLADLQTTLACSGNPSWYVKPFVGWQTYRENLKLFDGRWTVIRGRPEVQPIYGLDSRYSLEWQALRLGFQAGIELPDTPKPGAPRFGLKASLALLPYVRYQGEGSWNLRPDLNREPSFIHRAEEWGWCGWEGSLGLSYRPWELLEIEAGARAFGLQTSGGTHTAYFPDRTSLVSELDRAETRRLGLYLQLTGRY